MNIRPDVVELLRQGFNNEEIHRELGVDPKTAAKARRELSMPNAPRRRPAAPLERLYAEALPTGTVREYRPARMPTSPARAAANRAALEAAIRRPRRTNQAAHT